MDHQPPEHPEPLDAEQDAVRRLLAEARPTEPMPAEVAARLDGVLADLRADPRAEGPAPVARLDRHRRLGARRLLLAAAAVIVVGAGAAQVLHLDSAGTSAGTSGGASSAAADAGALPDPATDAPRSAFPAAGGASSGAAPSPGAVAGAAADSSTLAEAAQGRLRSPRVLDGRVRVTDADFSRDARRLQRRAQRPLPRLLGNVRGQAVTLDGVRRSDDAAACAPAPYGPGRLVLVRFRGDPAVLALRPRDGGSAQVADLLRCGTAEVLRSTTLR